MSPVFLTILLSNALVGWLTISLTYWLFSSKEGVLKDADLAAEVEPIIDQKLDRLIEQYSQQIPMLSLFLTVPLTAKVKLIAKEEILKAIPEIKTHAMTRIGKKLWQLKCLAALVGLGIGLFEIFLLLGLYN